MIYYNKMVLQTQVNSKHKNKFFNSRAFFKFT